MAGTVDWLVFPLIQALTFTAGISVLMTGVRMFLAEITAAFVAISDKFIPGSRPALDVPTIFPFAPTAVLVGFLSSYAAGLIAIVIMVIFHFPMVIIPAAHICFFSGGTAGIFGNSTGGWRGAISRIICCRATVSLPACPTVSNTFRFGHYHFNFPKCRL
ncbi:hypothetical protein KIH21_01055 [Lacticaseibacillus paracasei subsp. paracasei]|nr:hypothetical protein KIH21_01055 [Lacticaseibacillus paracasei subsp. paracasei]